LTIIVREDHNAPVVSAQAWAMAGSIHEDRWLGAGLSHTCSSKARRRARAAALTRKFKRPAVT
jgi:predicted Zn-dependent peptidase